MGTGTNAKLATIRRMLGAMFLVGSLGTGAELLLMDHTEGVWQNLPLALIAVGCCSLGVLVARRGALQMRAFQLVLVLFTASGIGGVLLHYRGNVEFALELSPDSSGVELFRESMKGATPALAPGMMILLGALGLAYSRLIEPE